MQAEGIESLFQNPSPNLSRQRTGVPQRRSSPFAGGAGREGGSERHIELSLWLTTDRIIQQLNRRFRHLDEPTDVLSFPQIEWKNREIGKLGDWEVGIPRSMGDVVISLPTARRQALQQRWSFEEEIAWLVVHGVLHLLGYEDETATEREQMLRRQEEILTMMRDA